VFVHWYWRRSFTSVCQKWQNHVYAYFTPIIIWIKGNNFDYLLLDSGGCALQIRPNKWLLDNTNGWEILVILTKSYVWG
jgi:hypothetical protein